MAKLMVLKIKCPISNTYIPIENYSKIHVSYLKYDSYGKIKILKPTHIL